MWPNETYLGGDPLSMCNAMPDPWWGPWMKKNQLLVLPLQTSAYSSTVSALSQSLRVILLSNGRSHQLLLVLIWIIMAGLLGPKVSLSLSEWFNSNSLSRSAERISSCLNSSRASTSILCGAALLRYLLAFFPTSLTFWVPIPSHPLPLNFILWS